MASESIAFTPPPPAAPEKTGASFSDASVTLPEQLDVEELRPPKRTRFRMFAILVGIYLAVFTAGIDETIIATAIPTISSSLHSNSGYFWIGGAYLLANAAASPIWSKCSDIWGRKPAFLLAVLGFALSSIMAALSVNIRMLIAARALQGTSGGGLLQLVAVTIGDLFSQRERALHFGILEVVWALSGGLGPIGGGVFAQLVGWRWCFWINLPICGITFILLLFFLDVHNPRTRFRDGIAAIDWFGTVSILGVTVMLLLGLDFGGITFPWSSPTVICLIIFGSLLVGLFIFSEMRLAKYPLMPMGLFKDNSNKAILVVCFTQGMAWIALQYYLPLYFQSAKHASPLRSGTLVLPLTISTAVSGFVTGLLVHRTGRYRELIWVGTFLLALGTGLVVSFDRTTSVTVIAVCIIVAGVGAGMLFAPPMIAIQAKVHQDDTASATATFSFFRNMATAISIILGGVVFQDGTTHRVAQLKAAGLNSTMIAHLSGGMAAANIDIIKTIENPSQRAAVESAFAWSLRNMWIMFTGVAFIGFVASLFIVQSHLSSEHTETKTGLKNREHQET